MAPPTIDASSANLYFMQEQAIKPLEGSLPFYFRDDVPVSPPFTDSSRSSSPETSPSQGKVSLSGNSNDGYGAYSTYSLSSSRSSHSPRVGPYSLPSGGAFSWPAAMALQSYSNSGGGYSECTDSGPKSKKRGNSDIDAYVDNQIEPPQYIKEPKKRKIDPRRNSLSSASNAEPLQAYNDSTGRLNKGLRHFSKQVCDKVQEKGLTTYNEVADELSLEIKAALHEVGGKFDQKNIRRRVYDALNVLMAMDIIAKEKKDIRWIGLPQTPPSVVKLHTRATSDQTRTKDDELSLIQRLKYLQEQHQQLQKVIKHSEQVVRDKLHRLLHVKSLIHRNAQQCHSGLHRHSQKIRLPCMILKTSVQNKVGAKISPDGRMASVRIQSYGDIGQDNFYIHSDFDILGSLDLGRVPTSKVMSWIKKPEWRVHLNVPDCVPSC
ncbi:hypothetical protein BZG36_04854 [Bifiguratus adelaidae]|uniref:E2F/DP family winged-helix DNA-binding domain-containing protein n=1 Tax=Bifiguratus adelaidae TaxID=1938954 RepID=A0A261XVJ8_9FUNG|nr:hypothetical protein BZG36_04854 [Bifiguratus adelaidae]